MDIKITTKENGGTKVRYAVHYNDRNYEYALHSGKRHFIRNIADVINILEYCIVQDLKNDLYAPSEKLYNFNVVRLVNDKPDEAFNGDEFIGSLRVIAARIIADNIQRNA